MNIKDEIQKRHNSVLNKTVNKSIPTIKKILSEYITDMKGICESLKVSGDIKDYYNFISPERVVTFIRYDATSDFKAYESIRIGGEVDVVREDSIPLFQFYKDMQNRVID